ncbi:MAG: hypothetical protein ACLQBL_28725 [Polyangiaceae bacterium]
MKRTTRIHIHLVLRLFLLALSACLTPACAAGTVGGYTFDDAGGGADGAPLATTDDATVAATVTVNDDAGVFAAPVFDDGSATSDDDGADDAPSGPPFDAGEGGLCTAPLAPGNLTIVELMIESTSGTGDHGEWVEVASTLSCALDLNGLQGECPSGAKVNAFAIQSDVWIPPLGTFLIADSTDPAVNHSLPGVVIPWSGGQGDVLRNEGATVTLLFGDTIIDSITYPDLKLTVGASTSFPSDCTRSLRPDWSAWQTSTASWFPAFRGTPNGPNVDVHCPTEADD